MSGPPKNDAAPSGNGAGVKQSFRESQSTTPGADLTPRFSRSAPRGTSDEAARRIARAAPRMRERVYEYLLACGPDGSTDEEAETALGMKPQSYTPRRGELVSLGLVRDTGRRRPTLSGRSAAVWATVSNTPEPNGEGGG